MTDISNLKSGSSYIVIKEFTDYDGKIHELGETWTFVKTAFLPYESGLSLFVIESEKEIIYRFQDEAEEQKDLLNDFMNYVEFVKNLE
jgi:hypothetical protein